MAPCYVVAGFLHLSPFSRDSVLRETLLARQSRTRNLWQGRDMGAKTCIPVRYPAFPYPWFISHHYLALELGATLVAACDTSLMERVRRRQVLAPSDMTLGKWGPTRVGIRAAHPCPSKAGEPSVANC